MKYTILTVSISIFLIISCNKETEFKAIKTSGILKVQGFTTYMYGSHCLTDENGKTKYALRIEKGSLEPYVNKKVKITGHKIKGYPMEGGPEFLEVTKIK